MPNDKTNSISQAILKINDHYQKVLEDLTHLAVATGEIEIGKAEDILEIVAQLNSEVENLCNNAEIRELEDVSNLNSEVRQSAILGKIKELSYKSDGCGLKDLLAFFPDVSDRTLRYDLQKLSNRGLVIKVGSRGPNTTYKAVL